MSDAPGTPRDPRDPRDSNERRRHARRPAHASVELLLSPPPGPVSLVDVSFGGLFVELAGPDPARHAVPALATRGRVQIRQGDVVVERRVRVVRIRWGGRERGQPVPPGLALAFEDLDDEKAALFEALLGV